MNDFIESHAKMAGIDPITYEHLRTQAQIMEASGMNRQKIAEKLQRENPHLFIHLSDRGRWIDGPLPVWAVTIKGKHGAVDAYLLHPQFGTTAL